MKITNEKIKKMQALGFTRALIDFNKDDGTTVSSNVDLDSLIIMSSQNQNMEVRQWLNFDDFDLFAQIDLGGIKKALRHGEANAELSRNASEEETYKFLLEYELKNNVRFGIEFLKKT
jgi:hypothetical protein